MKREKEERKKKKRRREGRGRASVVLSLWRKVRKEEEEWTEGRKK